MRSFLQECLNSMRAVWQCFGRDDRLAKRQMKVRQSVGLLTSVAARYAHD